MEPKITEKKWVITKLYNLPNLEEELKRKEAAHV